MLRQKVEMRKREFRTLWAKRIVARARLSSLDEMLDASRVLTNYLRSGVLDTAGCSIEVANYTNGAVKQGPEVTSRRLKKLNQTIVQVNRLKNPPTGFIRREYQKLFND